MKFLGQKKVVIDEVWKQIKEKSEQITSDHLRKQKIYKILGFPIMLEISKLATVFFWNKLKLIYHSNLNSIIS